MSLHCHFPTYLKVETGSGTRVITTGYPVLQPGTRFLKRIMLHITGRGAPDPYPDPDPAGSEVGSGKYWPDVHNSDIKRITAFFSFQEIRHDNRELHTKTHENSLGLTQSFQLSTVNVRH